MCLWIYLYDPNYSSFTDQRIDERSSIVFYAFFFSVTSAFLKILLSRHVKIHQMSWIRLIISSLLISGFDRGLLMGWIVHSTPLECCPSTNIPNTQNYKKTHFCLEVPFCTRRKAGSLRTCLTAQQKAFSACWTGVRPVLCLKLMLPLHVSVFASEQWNIWAGFAFSLLGKFEQVVYCLLSAFWKKCCLWVFRNLKFGPFGPWDFSLNHRSDTTTLSKHRNSGKMKQLCYVLTKYSIVKNIWLVKSLKFFLFGLCYCQLLLNIKQAFA